MKRNKKSSILFFMLAMLILVLSQCINRQKKNNDPRGEAFAVSATCRQCHQSVYDLYVTTTHYTTSRPASKENIKGSFTSGQNIFNYGPNEKVVMEQRDSGLFQVDYINGKEKEAQRFDITFGLKNGQTF